MSFNASLSETDLFLGVFQDGKLIIAAKYPTKESVGVSILVATSCLSLIAVLGLLVLMGVCNLFPTRLGVDPYEHAFLYRRLLPGPIGLPGTRTTSSEPMSLHISSVFWSPISFKARSIGRLLCWAAADTSLVALASIMNARWVQSGGVESGRFCTAQGTNV